MATLIVEFGGRYLEWSERVDAPVTTLMTLDELKTYTVHEHGYSALRDLTGRLERVGRNGTSSRIGITKQDLLEHNRAGHDESLVATEQEMVELYGDATTAPGFIPSEPLDLAKPMVMRDPYGYDPTVVTVTGVLEVEDGVAFAKVSLDDIDTHFHVLFDIQYGKVLTSNFACLQVFNA